MPTSVGQLTAHRRHQVPDARVRLHAEQFVAPRPYPGRQTRDRSLRIRSTIMMFSAASLAEARSTAALTGSGHAGRCP